MPIEDQDESSIKKKGGLFETLLEEFSALPKSAKDTKYEEYAVVNVGPSVVPNPYVPTFRIFSYNITEVNVESWNAAQKKKKKEGLKRRHGHHRGDRGNKTIHCKTEEYQDTWRCHLDNPWYSDPSAPSRANERWTPLGYAQVRDYISFDGSCTHHLISIIFRVLNKQTKHIHLSSSSNT